MTVTQRQLSMPGDEVATVAAEYNKLFMDVARMKASTVLSHIGPTALVTTADAAGATTVGTAAVVALATAMTTSYNAHRIDTFESVGCTGAHLASDTTNTVATAALVTDGDCATRLLALKVALKAHATQSGKHFTNDSATNGAIALSTNGTVSGNIALANQIKAAANVHYATGFVAEPISLVAP